MDLKIFKAFCSRRLPSWLFCTFSCPHDNFAHSVALSSRKLPTLMISMHILLRCLLATSNFLPSQHLFNWTAETLSNSVIISELVAKLLIRLITTLNCPSSSPQRHFLLDCFELFKDFRENLGITSCRQTCEYFSKQPQITHLYSASLSWSHLVRTVKIWKFLNIPTD